MCDKNINQISISKQLKIIIAGRIAALYIVWQQKTFKQQVEWLLKPVKFLSIKNIWKFAESKEAQTICCRELCVGEFSKNIVLVELESQLKAVHWPWLILKSFVFKFKTQRELNLVINKKMLKLAMFFVSVEFFDFLE